MQGDQAQFAKEQDDKSGNGASTWCKFEAELNDKSYSRQKQDFL